MTKVSGQQHEHHLPACYSAGVFEAGCDEAGRGCLAGPVYAAAVILPDDFSHPWLNDSKKLTEKRRDILRPIIEEQAVAWAIAWVEPGEIDEINILQATFLAMKRAVDGLEIKPDLALVDGNQIPPVNADVLTIVKGDGKSASIAAASIIAKVSRDRYMIELAKQYPQYEFERHKGYGTKLHYEKIAEHGICEAHRKTFLKKLLGEL